MNVKGKDMKFDPVYADGENSQYDDIKNEQGEPVDAIYIKALVEQDRGNPFIEALPYPRTERQIEFDYSTEIPSYSFEKATKLSTLEKMMNVSSLRGIRFRLPFHEQLEIEFYNAIVTSYRARKLLLSNNGTVINHVENNKVESKGILVGDSAEATNAGFSLTGYSGCGKSSAIKTLVSHYPQVIIHKFGEYGYYPQITYLVVNCVTNSNFAALYEGIGDAIDKALGNIEPVYAKEINKCRNLGIKAEKIRMLIERFAIGIIIFDEIQLINFEHTKENTFDSLLTLANKTKVAIAVVGTEEAREKMFSELRTSRRLGVMINGNAYCGSRRFFDYLAVNLFRYQWFDVPVAYSKEIGDTLYDLSKGIIDQLVSIYSAAHIEYLSKSKKPVVNADFFRKVAKKYYPGMQDVLANLENITNAQIINEIRHDADSKMKSIIDDEKQRASADKILSDVEERSWGVVTLSNVTALVRTLYEFSDDQIQDAYKKVMARSFLKSKNEKEIAQLVIEQIEKLPKTKKKPVKAAVMEGNYRSYLGIEE